MTPSKWAPHRNRFVHCGVQKQQATRCHSWTITTTVPQRPVINLRRPIGGVFRSFLHGTLAFILAANYFAFQVELFEDEYEENHPTPFPTCSLTRPTLSWESFDKDNALQAFAFNAEMRDEPVAFLPPVIPPRLNFTPAFHPIRDKSPPAAGDHHNLSA